MEQKCCHIRNPTILKRKNPSIPLKPRWHLANPPKTSDVHPKIKEQKGKSSCYSLSFVSEPNPSS
ncbi:hypothetical protein NC651_014720 [Populus alba x Populus x berolinensis]|nr:hypothetical protein NC651_014720 [Populus alba x Populus x berolinensis]